MVQDDLHQLLDMLPADLGGLLINHPKRQQLIEVRAYTPTPVHSNHTIAILQTGAQTNMPHPVHLVSRAIP